MWMYAFDASRYRRKREKLVERTYVSHLPTKWGLFQAYCYSSKLDGTEHVAIVKVNITLLIWFSRENLELQIIYTKTKQTKE
jgi:hypothetical protein